MMPGLRVQLCSAPKQLRTGEPLIKKQTNLIQRRKNMSIMVSVFVPDGIVMAADSRQTVGITAVKPVNGAQGTETRILNRMDRPGQPGFPAGTIISQSDNAQKIMLLSKVKVGISACGIGILDGKMFRIISARLKSTNSHRRMMSRVLPKSCINMHLNTFRRSVSLFAAIRTTNRLCTL